jgi:hypothetical protein
MNAMAGTSQKLCPQCGGIVDTDARFCKHCAFDLSNLSKSPDATKSHTKANPKPIFLIGGAAVIGLLILILGAYILTRNRSQPAAATTSSTPTPTPTMTDKAKQVEAKILRNESLTDSDIAGLSAFELRVLRNVHFARYGRKYDSPGLGDYFSTRPWYKPSDDYKDSMITAADKANINLILAAERVVGNSESANTTTTNTPTAVEPTPDPTIQRTNELDRQTALSLVRGRVEKVYEARMPDSSFYMYNKTPIYGQMVQDKIISCQWNRDRWNSCVPGAKGAFSKVLSGGWGGTLIIAMRKVPTEVSGISKMDQSTAIVDVVLSFEDTAGLRTYSKYSEAFDAPRPDTRPEIQKVLLRLYDDGWRVDRVINY